ncbi:MAG: dicarboxylate/amino acid:cation symporter [Salibacteraceae bacterium]
MISAKFKELTELTGYLQKLLESKLWLKILVGMFLGVIAGIMIAPKTGWVPISWSANLSGWLGFPGALFIKLVQMVMIPLIFSSIITGIASNTDTEKLKKVGLNLVLYFIGTTIVAVSIGLSLTNLIKPGNYFEQREMPTTTNVETGEVKSGLPSIGEIPDVITNLLPTNPMASIVTGEMLSIVLFTIIIGIAITFMDQKNKTPIISLLSSVQEICMTIVRWAMEIAPYAVFGLMAQLVLTVGLSSIIGLGMFMLTVLAGLVALLIFYLIVLLVVVRKSPFTFIKQVKDVQLLAFSTASSAAVMPLSMKVAIEKLKVSKFISKFIIPIGATVNMDGTALFQCASILFISQVYGMQFDVAALTLIMFTIVAASIGTPAIPGGGIIIMASVLEGTGLPAEGIMMLIGIDRIMGMFRTAVNVTGDLTACLVFDKWFGQNSNEETELEAAPN